MTFTDVTLEVRSAVRAAASFLRCASDRFLLTKPNTSCTIGMPASLRCVRVHPGMPFGIIPDSAFRFAGIPIQATIAQESTILMDSGIVIQRPALPRAPLSNSDVPWTLLPLSASQETLGPLFITNASPCTSIINLVPPSEVSWSRTAFGMASSNHT
jgi:hypothetical protein